jgi:hypothetical protein
VTSRTIAGMTEPLYVTDGELFVPSEHARGPWDAHSQHGGPPAALMVRAVEALPSEVPMTVARFTMEILKPVPLSPVTVAAHVERKGRRVQLVSAVLSSEGEVVCRARAWRIRVADIDVGEPSSTLPYGGPDQGALFPAESEEPAFHRTGVQLRFVRGRFWDVGPATVWIRLLRPVVDAEAPSPVQRVVAAADFGNGVSSTLAFGRYVYVNVDLTAYVHRQPVGEWICLDSQSSVNRTGVGLADSALYDIQGPIGRSLQTLYVDQLAIR